MSDIQDKKRKRLRNTTQEQFDIYLSLMENDTIFRTNTLNPTVEPDYLHNKWKELTLQLNAIGKGPELSVEEWKKRFKDWKYTTKAKCRKIMEHSKKTGSGPKLNLEMTPTEERGLTVWGKVTVMGANVTGYEGIEVQSEPAIQVQPEHSKTFEYENVDQSFDNIFEVTPNNTEPIIQQPIIAITSTKNEEKPPRNNQRRQKPLSVLAENLLKCSESATSGNAEVLQIVKTFCDKYIELEKEKLDLENKKFEFELSKFKYLNKDFDM